ncbi:MAG: MFS transporter, partial [Polyangiaceae bacterium]
MAQRLAQEGKGEISTARAWLVAIAATLAMSVSYIDRQILAVLGKSVREALSIDMTGFGYLASAFSIAYLVAAPISGILVDRFGARRSLVVAILFWSAVSAAHALVPTFGALFALRIALGTAEAPSFPSAAQAIKRILPARHRSAGYGLLFTGSSIGAMVAVPLAIQIKEAHGWRAAFLIGSIVGLVWLPFWLLATSGDAVGERLAKPNADERFETDTPKWTVLADPAVHRAVVLVMSAAPAIMFVLIFAPQFLEKTYRLSEKEIGHYAWLPPVFFDIGAIVFGAIASRRDPSPTREKVRSQPELTAVAGVLLSLIALAAYAPTPWTATIIASLALAGGGAINARLTADMIARIDPAHVSTAGGLCAAAQSLAYIVASPLVGR